MKMLLKYNTPEIKVCLVCDTDMVRTSLEKDFTNEEDDTVTTDKWGDKWGGVFG